LDPADRAARYTFADVGPDRPRTTVAVEGGGHICGFATTGPCRDSDKQAAGELYAVYVHPDRRGLGVGRILIRAACQQLADRGFSEGVLWVLVGNQRARHFYQTDGWSPDGQRRLDEVTASPSTRSAICGRSADGLSPQARCEARRWSTSDFDA
jgi:ribosomal protein S18 acetylase RimI-like enzyme